MRLRWSPGLVFIWGMVSAIITFKLSTSLEISLEVEQLPTITAHSPNSLIAFPFDESFPMTCEAKGNPEPEFRWTKNGQDFDPFLDSRLLKEVNAGTFVIPNNGNLSEYQGTYRCYASNKLGTAISEEIEFIVPNVPKFPKEKIEPLVVEEGRSFILECNPPSGIPPLQIYWMTIGLQHIEQDERVSMGLNGNLFFSNALEKDSRRDYCCYAAFPKIRTIVQKTAMSVIVKSTKLNSDTGSDTSPVRANSILERKPSFMTPSGDKSKKQLVKGEDLELECIAEGFPTPKIEWVKIGDKLPDRATVENHGKLLTIAQILDDDSGKYMCKAKNVHGEVAHYFDVTVEAPPEWEVEPHSQLSMIGSDVLIKCAATGNPQPTISWMVNGLPLKEVPASNRKVFDDTIFLHNAKASDSAVYQCEASNRHGTLLANSNIMIINLPPMIQTEDGQEYSAVEGKGAVMHCKVFSSPPSTISWNKDDTAVAVEGARFTVHENGSLEIYNVEKDDIGQYTCFTRNTEGMSAINAILDVKEPTRILEPPQDLWTLTGTTAQLSCQAEYDRSFSSDFEMVWQKDDMEIALNSTENSRYIVDDGILQIINISHKDQGLYTCKAKTPVDWDTASAQVIVLDVPDAPENLVLFEHKSRSVTLKWVPGDDHNSPITEFIIEFEESQWEPGNWKELLRVPGNHSSAHLKLHGNVDYRFRVSAASAVGRGRSSEPTERYTTPPAAPDKNPENIKIEGHLPHEMDINWGPLPPIEHNGPGLEYKVSYKRQDVEEDWQEHVVKRHSFLVKKTPTFVPYQIKIQARNNQGWGPEPNVMTGFSGEDFPSAAPEDVAVEVMNNSLVKVSWTRIHKDKLNGHLGGYRINWWRLRSLLDTQKTHGAKHTLTLLGDRSHALVPNLRAFSEYSLIVMAFNGRGNSPGSHPVNFKTPEGVPDKSPFFRATDIQKHSVTMAWSPPLEANGILTGFILQYQLINDTEDVRRVQQVNISKSETKQWLLQDLEAVSKYKFYLQACTREGCGPAVSEECTTVPEARLASIQGGISTQGWFIGLMCAVALLTLIVLITCFINRNKGGKYSVKEKEDLHPDIESQGMNDDTFCEYSDNDEKPLKGSQRSLSREIKAGESGDSLVDYGEEEGQFNEDGSFIGEYADRKKRASMEVKGTNQITA